MANFRPVIFKLDEESYGIDITRVEAIERGQSVVRVPNSAQNIKGIINLRGEIIPVVSLRSKFSLKESASYHESELMIVTIASSKVAFEVDKVNEIHDVDERNVIPMPSIAVGEGVDYFDKVAKIDNNLIIIVKPDKILSEAEIAVAKQMVDSMSNSDNNN